MNKTQTVFKRNVGGRESDMVLNTTFNNSSVISWRSVLLVDETGANHRPIQYTSPEEIQTHNFSGDMH